MSGDGWVVGAREVFFIEGWGLVSLSRERRVIWERSWGGVFSGSGFMFRY